MKEKDKLNFKNLAFIFLAVLLIILIFTFLDFLVHQLKEEYSVPSYYFRNKIISGTIIGFIASLVLRKEKLFPKTLMFSLIISALLQIRYFLEGYSLKFVIEFLVFHFVILFVVSLLIFKFLENRKE